MLRSAYRWVTDRLKFAYLWVFRILFAPNHFGVSLFKRIKWAVCGGYMCDQVALYHLDRETRKDYLSEFDWYRSRVINHPYETMLNNKVLCAQMLTPYASVPEVLFFMEKGKIVCPQRADRWATQDEILATIREQGKVFIKPVSSGKGKGVHLLGYENGSYHIDLEPVAESAIRAQISEKDWHIVECASQSAFLNGIFPHASNTIRAITLRDPETGSYRMFFAVLRIGTDSTIPVDNGSKGGLVAKIDLETGELSEARSIQADVHMSVHPDTGAQIEGARIPNWHQVRQQVVALAEHLPCMEFIAWDILLTDDGFTVIEANASSGVNIIQIWGGQRHGELGAFYRAHKIIR